MKLKSKLFTIAKQSVPPIILLGLKRTGLYRPLLRLQTWFLISKQTPRWETVKAGPLTGTRIYSTGLGGFEEMVRGHYDQFFTDYLERHDLRGRVVLDIGAHVGFSSLLFAKAVGPQGRVIAFEPNPFNRERFEKILAGNPELSKPITINPAAVADRIGSEEFVFSSGVDEGTSSGSFIDRASTIWEKDLYEREIGFQRMNVNLITLDSLDLPTKPALVKIDVEGAEYLVMAGGRQFFRRYQPLILMEVHSIFNMFKVAEELQALGYQSQLLAQEPDGRCFLAAKPQ